MNQFIISFEKNQDQVQELYRENAALKEENDRIQKEINTLTHEYKSWQTRDQVICNGLIFSESSQLEALRTSISQVEERIQTLTAKQAILCQNTKLKHIQILETAQNARSHFVTSSQLLLSQKQKLEHKEEQKKSVEHRMLLDLQLIEEETFQVEFELANTRERIKQTEIQCRHHMDLLSSAARLRRNERNSLPRHKPEADNGSQRFEMKANPIFGNFDVVQAFEQQRKQRFGE